MRLAVWYIVFVGLPVAGLVGILRLGERLTPPQAVHGSYVVALDSGTKANPCLAHLLVNRRPSLIVSQYGPRLEVRIGADGSVVLRGSIVESTVSATGSLPRGVLAKTAGCLPGDTLTLSATVERIGTERLLTGRLALRGCSECPPFAFRATRSRHEVAAGGP